MERFKLIDVLRSQFGFPEFRDGQREAIETLLTQNRLLCILPTGHGKSLIYQLPAVILPGLTLVISPLLALMRDQIEQLDQRFGVPAASINSDQTDDENALARVRAARGELKILFVAPEQLDNLEAAAFFQTLPVSLVVVDEAHCISVWGHDFRPSYRGIVRAIEGLAAKHSDLCVLGLTATADKRTEQDIREQLGVGGAIAVIRQSMDRPNLSLSVRKVDGLAEKLAFLGNHLRAARGTTVIYCATREHTELVAAHLTRIGIPAAAYHAGLEADVKRRLQREFFSGALPLVAATNALGMGIDKGDVREIIHFDIPSSITAYYQEVGRAGRDGLPSQGLLLFDPADRRVQEHFIRSAQPTQDDFAQVLGAVDTADEPLGLVAIRSRCGLHPTLVTVILADLVEQGILSKELLGRKTVYLRVGASQPSLSRFIAQSQVRHRELEAMFTYAHGTTCLMAMLRAHLGDENAVACRHCGVCTPSVTSQAPTAEQTSTVSRWLLERPQPIAASNRPKMSEGLSVLDGMIRSDVFVDFMRKRSSDADLSPLLKVALANSLQLLRSRYPITAVVALPSRTWLQRRAALDLIEHELRLTVHADAFSWESVPEKRQGELLNNDQRKQNVKGNLQFRFAKPLGKGAVLLVDDYTGSGATLREACRALRDATGFEGDVVPFTLARIRWRLGQTGMI